MIVFSIILYFYFNNIVKKINNKINSLQEHEEYPFEIIKISEKVKECVYKSEGSTCFDIYSMKNNVVLKTNEIVKLKTGLKFKFSSDLHVQIQNRSSMFTSGIQVLNGIIDSDYEDEIIVVVVNVTEKEIILNNKNAIAQVSVLRNIKVSSIKRLETVRKGGFGSTSESE